jgi:hypothetical protein
VNNTLKRWKFEIAGHTPGTALPSEINAIVTEFAERLNKCGLNVQTFHGHLDGSNVDLLKQAGVEVAANA